jgi:hypothetical protein
MMSLRISYHPCIVMSCAIVLAHRALQLREALHTGAKFYSETCRLEPLEYPFGPGNGGVPGSSVVDQ